MTRPLGKSPARSKNKRSQLDLNQISLIDVGAEDDSLLPMQHKATPHRPAFRSSPLVVSPFKASSGGSLASIQEDQPQNEEVPGSNDDEAQDTLAPLPTEEPGLKKKKKKSGFNLRKSLAWNNAFFTEEGVLDPEELSLVNRTFKKPLEEPKPVSNKKPTLASKLLNPSAISKINFSPVRFQKPSVPMESRHNSPLINTGPVSKRGDTHNRTRGFSGSKQVAGSTSLRLQNDPIKHDNSMFSMRTEFHGQKPSPLKKCIEENLRTVSGPPLPARQKPPLEQPRSITSTISSASKKMKDRLGMVFTGRNAGNQTSGTQSTCRDDVAVNPLRAPDYSDSAKLTRCYSHMSYERSGKSNFGTSKEPVAGTNALPSNVGSSDLNGTLIGKANRFTMCNTFSSNGGSLEALHNVKEHTSPALFLHPPAVRSSSKPHEKSALAGMNSITKEAAEDHESLLSRAKPSGLRMPSPKLGFFDKARTFTAPQVGMLRERTNGLGYDSVPLQSARNMSTSRPLSGYTSGASSNAKQSSGFNVIPHSVKTTNRHPTESGDDYVKQASTLKPPVSSANSSHLHFESIGRSKGTGLIPTAPHLRHTECSSRMAASTQGSSSEVHSSTENASSPICNSSITAQGSSTANGASSIASHSNKSETQASNMGAVLQIKKNGHNVMPAVKKMVNQLNLSPLRIVSGQENLEISQKKGKSPKGKERLHGSGDFDGVCATGAPEEWPQVKSGAVQHSPPNKESPKYGPWSPVRRNAPELGPFDCTKYTNIGIL